MNPERTKPEFWKARLERAKALGMPPRWAVYEVSETDWNTVQCQTTDILDKLVGYGDSVLDIGCGIGAACECLPYSARYTGFDVSPDLIELAKERYAGERQRFFVDDVQSLPQIVPEFMRYDLAFGRSVNSTIGANLPAGAWDDVKRRLKLIARKVVWIEYDWNWVEESRPMKLTWRVDE